MKYLIVSASKPGLVLANKPFKLVSDLIQYFEKISNYKILNKSLEDENKFLKRI